MKTKKIELGKKDLVHLSHLSCLHLSDEELNKIGQQLNETLDYFENLKELDTSKIADSSYTTAATNVFRDDIVDTKAQLDQDSILKNAKKKKDNFFVVTRIL